jgi:glycosyltransferase involved in cell wall biosynthesis
MTNIISVIIPIYNDEEGGCLVIDALLNQDYPKYLFEIILVDNGSTDNTRAILQNYADANADRIIMAHQDDIQGSYAARNRGIEFAKGDILAFTDADCVPDRSWLTNGVKSILKENASFGAGHINMTFQSESPNIWEYVDAAGKLNQKRYVENSGFGATANLFVRRNVIDKNGWFNEKLTSGGDYEFGNRLSSSGEKLIYIENAVVNHPARSSFSEKIRKSRRVAEGQRTLANMGALKHNVISFRSFIPVRRCAKLSGVHIGPFKLIGVLLAANILKYYNLILRLLP